MHSTRYNHENIKVFWLISKEFVLCGQIVIQREEFTRKADVGVCFLQPNIITTKLTEKEITIN